MKKRKIIVIVTIAFMITLFGAMSYAFFTAGADNSNMTKANLTTGTMALTFADNDNGINERLLFGESVTKKFTIQNTGTLDSSLSMDWDELVNTYTNGSLSYKLEYSDTEDGEYQTLVDTSNIPVSTSDLTQTMAGEISVPAGSTYYYNLIVTLENLPDVDQSDDVDAIFHTKFTVGQPLKYRFYELVVDPSGGEWNSFSEAQTYQLQNNETQSLPEPTRVGYTFAGWKLQGVSSSVNDETFTMGLANTTLTAEWEAKSYTVSIDADGGEYTGETSIALDYDSSITLATPTREGYTFNGWMVSGGTLEGNTFTLTDASNVSITASWSVNSYGYTIIHRQMNVSGSGYTEVDRETGSLNYGEILSPTPKVYTGFTAPSKETITIGVDESSNVITYDYDRNQYTLTIDVDGGTYSGDTSIKMYYGASTTITTPTKEGHTFTGWTVPSGELNSTTFTIGASNVTLTATWETNDYKYIVYHNQMNTNGSGYTLVSADTNEGTAKYGSTLTPNVNTYTGFTSPSKQSLTIKVDTNTPPTLNVVNYNYTRNQYTLTIKPNGGTYNSSTSDTTKKMYYNTSTTISTPTREGYTFTGWTKSAGTISGSTFTIDASDASLTAGWSVNSYAYTVNHYQMNVSGSGYTLKETENLTADYGTTQTPAVKTYIGFTAPSTKSVTIVVDTTQNVVNYYYSRNQYTLTVNANGGSTTVTSGKRYYGAQVSLSASRTGYNLSSWTRTSGTAGTISGSTFTMGAGDATVQANWTAKEFTVTFNANGGTTPTASKTVTYGNTYGTLPTPTYTGYNFLGWYTAASGGTQITSTTAVTITASQTLYAQWKRDVVGATLDTLGIAPNSGTPTFSSVATTDEGVYALEDNYGTSYYYRGAVTNNYVQFAGFYWRIIRVNGDGSVRMIYDGTQAYSNGTSATARNALTRVAWNTTYPDDVKYVGYMYGGAKGTASTSKAGAQTNETSSNVKTQLESWYTTNIETPGYEKYLADVIFCNDRSTPDSTFNIGYGTNITYYGAYNRFVTNQSSSTPTFICPTNNTVSSNNDWFTADATTINKGNGALNQPVGLITADEVVAAGSGQFGRSNSSYYLYKGNDYLAFSPSSIHVIEDAEEGHWGAEAFVFTVTNSGQFSIGYVHNSYAVAPVINLSAEYAAQLKGTGISTDPFTLE